jgi:hypothetical protein
MFKNNQYVTHILNEIFKMRIPMTMKHISYLFFVVIIVILSNCSSGKKTLEKGNYYQSSIQAVERLRRNPNHKKSIEVLSTSYPLAVKYYMDRVYNYNHSNDPFKSGKMIQQYEMLNALYEQIMRSPGALNVIPDPNKYYDEIRQITEMAAEEHYQAGTDALAIRTRESAKDAYYHFMKAVEYVPNYKDSENKVEESLDLATLKVIVDQIPLPTVNFQLSVDFFQDQVEEFFFHYNDNPFVRFYSTKDTWLENPDQIMVIMFDQFSVGNTNNLQKTFLAENDSVEVGTVTLEDGTKKPVIGTVKAEFTEYTREVISNGLLTMKIMEAGTERIILHEKFPGEFVWVSRWASFNGDERALTKEQLNLTKHKPINPPPPQDMFIEFTKPIYNQMTSTVARYYNNY